MTEQTKYAIAYARVSTDDHDQNPESQLVKIRSWAKDRNIVIVEEYKDESTGTNDDRIGLDAVFGGKLRHPEVSMLIVLDADRLSRNMEDTSRIIRDCNKFGMQVVYVADENLDLRTKEGLLMNAMKSYGAQAYTDGHSLKIKAGLERARQEGKHIGRPLVREDDINVDVLLGLIRSGYTLRTLEKMYGCSRATLVRRIEKAGRGDEYRLLVEDRKIKGKEIPTNA